MLTVPGQEDCKLSPLPERNVNELLVNAKRPKDSGHRPARSVTPNRCLGVGQRELDPVDVPT